ncbi:D-Ala-D-Ala carboxypeptidase family metallohydrolase [Alphaproteobacteria bacterium]|jgi:zinc D-Ala-D-Ala carboxypeptidase|nr:D-Ala-D-Ala carboxypeptidase family metallohydrolase [Alphaproteobacteria bacterium]
MKLSGHFSLAELTKSQTATRKGIDNKPTLEHIENLTELCVQILEPTRRNFGKPMVITSGYRSEELCEAIGSKTTSQHAKGEAADFEMFGVDNKELAKYIKNNLVFDQLILEFYNPDDPSSGWVHCSYSKEENRKQSLLYNGKDYTEWLT